MSYELVIGAGILSFLFLYIAQMIDAKEHFALRLLLIGFSVILLIPLGKGVIDSSSVCESVVNSTSLNSATNVTTYSYTSYCYDVTSGTSHFTLYKISLWGFYLFTAYVMFYFVYFIFKDRAARILRDVQQKFGRRRKK